MVIDTCRSSQCGKKYKLEEIHVIPNSSKEGAEIKCPYCGALYDKKTSGHFRTTKLTPEEASRL
jgi:DNA-directed RNA polymerase subunit RPC12/RpoP